MWMITRISAKDTQTENLIIRDSGACILQGSIPVFINCCAENVLVHASFTYFVDFKAVECVLVF